MGDSLKFGEVPFSVVFFKQSSPWYIGKTSINIWSHLCSQVPNLNYCYNLHEQTRFVLKVLNTKAHYGLSLTAANER